jgi:hypothetical protein
METFHEKAAASPSHRTMSTCWVPSGDVSTYVLPSGRIEAVTDTDATASPGATSDFITGFATSASRRQRVSRSARSRFPTTTLPISCGAVSTATGSVLVYTDRYHIEKNARYVYERLYVSLVSASPAFVNWIQASAHHLLGVRGAITGTPGGDRRPMWKLRYAKHESICLLRAMYYAPDVCCLWRKRAVAERFLRPLGYASVRPSGRPRVGWLYNERSEGTR